MSVVTSPKITPKSNTIQTQRRKLGEYSWAILFILPASIFYIAILVLPLFRSIQLSFFDWDGMSDTMNFVGISNYKSIGMEPRFIWSLIRTLIFWIGHVIFAVGGGLAIALLISQVRWGQGVFRTLTFLPHVLSLAVVGIIWGQMYHPSIGFINNVLEAIGLDFLTNAWLGDPLLALPAISIASSWQAYGFYLVIFLAGIQGIDPVLYEAASVDGAKARQRLWYITLPTLRNTMTLVLTLAFISALKGFGTVWAMTGGGPVYASELVAVYIWRVAFQSGEIGIASAAAFVLGVAVIVVTIVFNQWRDKGAE